MYKYFISPLLGSNCRYYPTCSSYAIWVLENDNFFSAFFKILFRVARCNQLFKGGFDYPKIKREIKPIYNKKIKVNYWYIPIEKNQFLIIKAENE